MNQVQLPQSLLRLQHVVRQDVGADRELALGAVTFPAYKFDQPQDLMEQLVQQRWVAMPPELLPFASDAVGNRFCLYREHSQQNPEKMPVVYWMYETTLAVPVATSFDRFLDWVGLVAEIHVRRGADDGQTREHYDRVVEPALKQLGVERDFFALTTSTLSPVGSLHQGMLRVDPQAQGSRLVAAKRAQMDNRQRDAIVHARTALGSFPHFLSALWFLVTFDNAPVRVIGWKVLVKRLLNMPFVYRGDPAMAEFVELPSPSLTDVTALVSGVLTASEVAEDPVAELMLYDVVYEPENWLSVAVELANMRQYERAHVAAMNATYLACDVDVTEDIWRFQCDLYHELEWTWYESIIRRQLNGEEWQSDMYKRIL